MPHTESKKLSSNEDVQRATGIPGQSPDINDRIATVPEHLAVNHPFVNKELEMVCEGCDIYTVRNVEGFDRTGNGVLIFMLLEKLKRSGTGRSAMRE